MVGPIGLVDQVLEIDLVDQVVQVDQGVKGHLVVMVVGQLAFVVMAMSLIVLAQTHVETTADPTASAQMGHLFHLQLPQILQQVPTLGVQPKQ